MSRKRLTRRRKHTLSRTPNTVLPGCFTHPTPCGAQGTSQLTLVRAFVWTVAPAVQAAARRAAVHQPDSRGRRVLLSDRVYGGAVCRGRVQRSGRRARPARRRHNVHPPPSGSAAAGGDGAVVLLRGGASGAGRVAVRVPALLSFSSAWTPCASMVWGDAHPAAYNPLPRCVHRLPPLLSLFCDFMWSGRKRTTSSCGTQLDVVVKAAGALSTRKRGWCIRVPTAYS